jgi:hypothetical protein
MKQVIICITIFAIHMLASTVSQAAPANPDVMDITQPDGSTLSTRLHGDEFQSWTKLAQSGHTILRNKANGYWEYAEQNRDASTTPLERLEKALFGQ